MAMVIVGIYVDEATRFWAHSSADMSLVTCDLEGGKLVKRSEENVGNRFDRRLEPGLYGLKCQPDVTFRRPSQGGPLRIVTKGGKDPWPVPLQTQPRGKLTAAPDPDWKEFHSQSGDLGTKFLFTASAPDGELIMVERISMLRSELEDQIKAGATP